MFIWKNWNIDKDFQIKLERENETVKQLICESTPENKSNYSTSNLLNSSLIDNYNQILIKYISKESQTDSYECHECVELNKKYKDLLNRNEELELKIEELHQNIKNTLKDKDKHFEAFVQLQLDNDKLQIKNNIQIENKKLLEQKNKELNHDINEMIKKQNDIVQVLNEQEIKNKELNFEITKKINEMKDIKSENKRLQSENYYLVNKINDFKNAGTDFYENDYNNVDHPYLSKKKVFQSNGGMDILTDNNENDYYFEYMDLQKKYDDILNKMKEVCLKNDELNKRVRDYEIQNMIQFNRAIRSRIPIAFHAVHTDISNLN
jgi:hypothetical protein